jgi:2-methylcitrate dehydratase PrpD
MTALEQLGAFVVSAAPPEEARLRAARAWLDTVGVMLAGSAEAPARIVQQVVEREGGEACHVLGTNLRAGPTGAALANGTAAHALDFDDMCFVSLAHPSAPLVAASMAAAETAGSGGRAVLDAYVIGFEIEARLGALMNPRHYRRGWHCTSTLGTVGAAAAVSRLLGLDPASAGHALAIAASDASGLKENFGTMVKPLHAGLAARSGVLAGFLASRGMTASPVALDGPQGLLRAMDSERDDLAGAVGDLGGRWEIVESGITVKLYPSCAATHPVLDVLLDVRRLEGVTADDIDHVEVTTDSVTPHVLIYDRPATALEAKFSLPFCVAAALVYGRIDVGTFDDHVVTDTRITSLLPRIRANVDTSLDTGGPPLTQAQVSLHLRDGRTIERTARGARGYPDRPATDVEIDAKFISCAERVLSPERALRAIDALRSLRSAGDLTDLIAILT